jgi:hypothetical protein
MPLGEEITLTTEEIADRTVRLCKASEKGFAEYKKTDDGAFAPVYVIGSEVPTPGGSGEEDALSVTKPEALKEMLDGAISVLGEGGRLVVITYHSLEDRIVKNVMKAGNAEGRVSQDFFGRTEAPLKALSGKVITPSAEELERNPRSRSAKLRTAVKC